MQDNRMDEWMEIMAGLIRVCNDLVKEKHLEAVRKAIEFIYDRHHPMEPEIDGFKVISCPVCEALLRGPYCHECGQRVFWGGDGHGKDAGA